MDSFEINKILGAVLGTLLVLLSLSIVSEAIYATDAPEQPGYMIAALEPEHGGETGGPGGETAAAVPIATLLQSADPGRGATAAKKCQSCHTFQKGEPKRVGPNLYGVVGATVAHAPDFTYSEAMTALHDAGETWTFDRLNAFLINPKGEIPGTAMAFAGLKRDPERADVIAFLRTLSDAPVPLPEAPAAAAAAPEAVPEPASGTPAAGHETPAAPQGGTRPTQPQPQLNQTPVTPPAGPTSP